MGLKINMFPHIQAKESALGRPLTNREMARGSGIHESTFSTYRAGIVKMVRLDTMQKLANYFDCLAGELLSLEEKPEIS